MRKTDFIPVEVLLDQYELNLFDEGVLPDEPLPEKKGDPYLRVEYMRNKGDKTAAVLLGALGMDLSEGLPEGYEEIEEQLMEE